MILRRILAAGGMYWLLTFCCALVLAAEVEPEPPGARIVQQEHQRILAALTKPADWHYTDAPLKDVLEAVGDQLGVNVYVDTRALEDYGIGTDTPVTVNLAGISGQSLLTLFLRDLDLTWSVREGLLWITTPEEQESQLVTKMYPVGDLIRVSNGAEVVYDYDILKSAITSLIEPASWDSVGGPGSIEGVYAALVVSQVSQVHRRIEQLLAGYRKLARQLREHPNAVPTPQVLDAAGSERIRTELEKQTAIELIDVPLRDAMDHVAVLHDIPILIDTRALEDYGIGTDTPITLAMKSLPLRNTLRVLLDGLDLTWVVRDEVLMITTPEEAESLLQVTVYPVGDLVAPLEGSYYARYLDELAPAGNRDFDSLIGTITSTIAPESWDAVGGPSGIEKLETPAFSALLISQTEDVHDQILNLLAEMRRLRRHEQQRLETVARAETDRSKHLIKAYPLVHVGEETGATNQVVELLQRVLGPDVWFKDSQAVLQPAGNMLVIRHTLQVHREVQRLLQEVGVWSPPLGGGQGQGGATPQGSAGGGGLF